MNLDKLTYAGNLNDVRDLRGEKRHRLMRGGIRNPKLVTALVT
jgi:dTDP-D-glucose 4,6-dehydratase